jgi:hypothetical protein
MPKLGLGLGIFNNTFSKNLSDIAIIWRNNIIANGGTISGEKLSIIDNYLIKPMIANPLIFNKLDRLNLYAGLLGFEIAARTNIIKSAHYVTPVSSPTFDNNGYRSSGTSYLDLNYIQSTQGVTLTQNSASIGVVVKTPSYAALTRMIGSTGSTGRATYLIRQTTPSLLAGINTLDGAIANTSTITSGNVFFETIRNNSTQITALINGVPSVGSQASNVTLPNVSAFELTMNNNGVPQGAYDTNSHLCSWHGAGNLDSAELRNILTNLFTALGV